MEIETDTGGPGSATPITAQWPVGSKRQLTEEEKKTFLDLFPRPILQNHAHYLWGYRDVLDELSFSGPSSGPRYFQALVSICTSPGSLLRISGSHSGKGSISLFGQDDGGQPLMPSADDNPGRLAISLCVLSNLLEAHLEQQLLPNRWTVSAIY